MNVLEHLYPADDGFPLTIRDSGQGHPVLILHGGSGPEGVDPLIDHLSGDHRVLAPIHPGWEDVPRPNWFSGIGDLADAYLDVLAEFAPQGAAVIGNSFGGWIASEMAIRDQAHTIDRLILIDAIGPEIPGHPIQVPRRPGQGEEPPSVAALRTYIDPTKGDESLLPRLSAVEIPTLVLWGEHDPVVGTEFGRIYASAFPHSQFTVLPGAGHVPTREKPAETFAAIDTFLTTGRAR
ncbi:alpha/beta fold hydrolase [Streptomyces sp. MMS24-I2-30]|uniref:alpha/beta fold hydrolase n=1 Tax=Streptomyces sp. MMS24-I2-30 TaxID=3351564 RepID=UPI003896A2A7